MITLAVTSVPASGSSCSSSCGCGKDCGKNDCLPSNVIEITETCPGISNSLKSYIDVTVNHGEILSFCQCPYTYNGWSAANPSTSPIICGSTYSANAISDCDLNLVAKLTAFGATVLTTSIPEVNYILTNVARYENTLGYTYGDIQTALWSLLIGPGTTDVSAPFTPANVTAILTDADTNGSSFIPYLPTDYIGVFLVPVGTWPNSGSSIIAPLVLIQVRLCQFHAPCSFTQWAGLTNPIIQRQYGYFYNNALQTLSSEFPGNRLAFPLAASVNTNGIMYNAGTQQFNFTKPGNYQFDLYVRFSSVGESGVALAAFYVLANTPVTASVYGAPTDLERRAIFLANIPSVAESVVFSIHATSLFTVDVAAGTVDPVAGTEVTASVIITELFN